jgi:hypothetical protein
MYLEEWIESFNRTKNRLNPILLLTEADENGYEEKIGDPRAI